VEVGERSVLGMNYRMNELTGAVALAQLRKLDRIVAVLNEIIYTIEANGFLRYMVRTIAGTLIEVGRGKMEPRQIEDAFPKKDRSLAGPTAPARGLCLVKVTY
jgi:tRNA pseudouridine(38-40) synthase